MHGSGPTTHAVSDRLTYLLIWVVSVCLVGVVSVVVTTSLAALIFAGPLEVFLPIGLAAGLTGGVVVNLAIGATARSGALVALPAATAAVVLSIVMAGLSATLGEVPPEVMAASAALALAAATFVTGLLFLVAGMFRLGEAARYVPYPVVAGFLGGVGVLTVRGALELAAVPAGGALLDAAAVAHWLPALLLGAAFLVVMRLWRTRALLPVVIVAAVGLYHIGLMAFGFDIAAATRAGLLLGRPDAAAAAPFPLFGIARHADLPAILGQWPSIAVLALIALVAATLGASGVELSTRREIHIDRDLRTIGLGNIAAAVGGGINAYHNVGATVLLHRMLDGASGRAGLGVALVLAVVLVGGMEPLMLLPRVVCAAVLVYVGLDLVQSWVLTARRRMPRGDFAILLGIVVVGVTVGFLEAVAVGMAAAVVLFIVNYARLDFVRTALDGRLRQSTIERGEAQRQTIVAAGAGVGIFELQGYVFFGSARRLLHRLSGALSSDTTSLRAIIVDFRHTQGVDVSAGVALAGLARRCTARGVRLWFTDTTAGLDAMIRLADPAADFRMAPNLDVALAWEEDELLSHLPPGPPASALAEVMSRIDAAGFGALFERRRIAAGTLLYREGDPSDSLVLLEAGCMSARVSTSGGAEVKVATILPDALIGEVGFFGGVARTATVLAETDSVVRIVRSADLDQLGLRAPKLCEAFLRHGASLMAHRLARTNALLRVTYR